MNDLLAITLPWVAVAPAGFYAVWSLACGWVFFRKAPPETTFRPPVTVIKPVKGLDADSFENFSSFCRQEYPAFQLLFAVRDRTDPVVPVVERLIAAFPEADIDLVVDATFHGPNYKVGNLINAFPRAKYDLIVICDSDIRVGPEYLREVSAPFADPAVGLVTSLYRSPRIPGVACAVEAIGFTVDMAPNVLVARALEGLSFSLGAATAVTRGALVAVGGFEPLAGYLADDYQLGNRIHRAGYRLELSNHVVESVMHREDLRSVLSRQLRWARTMRVSRPAGYLASVITQPFPSACLALGLSGFSGTGVAAVAVLYLIRSFSACVFSRRFLKDRLFPRWLWLLPVRDMVAFVIWGLSFLGRRVTWRGHRYILASDGRIRETAEE